jgi:hypothetical protein
MQFFVLAITTCNKKIMPPFSGLKTRLNIATIIPTLWVLKALPNPLWIKSFLANALAVLFLRKKSEWRKA